LGLSSSSSSSSLSSSSSSSSASSPSSERGILKPEITPRRYQAAIADSASRGNTLVILPTGLGKTLIAVLVAAKRLEEFQGMGRVLVLAPTKPLVLQHKEVFERSLLLPEESFALLTGETSLEERKSKVWRGRVDDDSDDQKDESSPQSSATESKPCQFVFATPETVLNDIMSGVATLSSKSSSPLKYFVLLVFDEAHRAVGDYAYTQLAKVYLREALRPLILGLTASPGGSIERVDEVMTNLSIQKIESRTEDDPDVKEYVEETRIQAIKVSLPPKFGVLRSLLRSLYEEKIEKLKRGGFVRSSSSFFFKGESRVTKKALLQSRSEIVARINWLKQLQQQEHQSNYNDSLSEANARALAYGALITQSQAVIILHAIELLETQGLYTLQRYLARLKENPEEHGKSAKALFKDERWGKVESELSKLVLLPVSSGTTSSSTKTLAEEYDHPKLSILKLIIKEQLERKPNSKIIVFTQYRDTIDMIISKLEAGASSSSNPSLGPLSSSSSSSSPSSSSSSPSTTTLSPSPPSSPSSPSPSLPPSSFSPQVRIRCQRFVGQARRSDEDRGMSQKVQKEILEKFRSSNDFNVLVSSSIGEEGLHVPDVDLVVFYEAVPSEIRAIQRKGRTGRTMPGRVVVLLTEGTVDEAYYYSSQYKEKRMKKLVQSEAGGRIIKAFGGEQEYADADEDEKEKENIQATRRRGRSTSLLDYM
jgi:ERCC4-related helicase